MKMFISKTINFYKRTDIQKELIRIAEDKEVSVNFNNKYFSKRPDTLKHPNDIIEFVKKGATSFHASEETWKNPYQLTTGLKKEELNELRKGWDLVLDIDCALIDYSKIAAYYTIKVLKHHGIKSLTCKFSGNKGFHIAVPFEAFPEIIGGTTTKDLFPEAPRKIAEYIKYLIKDPVSKAIMKIEKNNFEKIVKKTGKQANEIIREEKNEYGDKVEMLNAEPFLDIDTILISPRHLFRMPYSFHEKSKLISIPINPDEILSFSKEQAKPEHVELKNKFLIRQGIIKNEASNLLIEALDFKTEENEIIKDKQEKEFNYEELTKAIPEEFFPQCITTILKGLEDGRKRALFILINFLTSVGWSQELIEDRINKWNKKNPEPLRDAYITGQLRSAKQKNKKALPPNCNHDGYYRAMGITCDDNLCVTRKIKNPVQYTKIKAKNFLNETKKQELTKKE